MSSIITRGSPPDSEPGHLATAVALLAGLAGSLHLVAAWSHRDHDTLAGLFLAAALLQTAWAAALAWRPQVRPLLLLGVALHGGFVAFYVLTRLTGLSGVDGLEEAQPVGFADLVTTLLEVGVVAGAVALLAPDLVLPAGRSASLSRRGLGLVTVALLLLGGPALVAGAGHDGSHGHGGGHGHAHGDDGAHDHESGHGPGRDDHDGADRHGPGADGHGDHEDDHPATGHDDDHTGTGADHDDDHRGHDPDGDDGHDDPGGHDPGGHDPGGHNPGGHDPGGHDPGGHDPGGHDPGGHDPGGHDPGGHDPGGHDPGGNDPGNGFPPHWTPEQVATAEQLIAATERAMAHFRDPAAAEATGFTWFGDLAPGGYSHMINWDWIDDDRILDPEQPESLVFRNTASGPVLEAAMFIVPSRYEMSTLPEDIAWLAGWHDHDNLCVDENRQFVGLAWDGRCSSGELLAIPPMTHVWIVDTPCGRFAAVDESGLHCDHQHER